MIKRFFLALRMGLPSFLRLVLFSLAACHCVLIFSQFVEVGGSSQPAGKLLRAGMLLMRCAAAYGGLDARAADALVCAVYYEVSPASPLQMLDILEDFLHDFQDASGLLPKAEEDPSKAPTASGAQDRCACSTQLQWQLGRRGLLCILGP